MSAVWMRMRAEARARWRGWFALALIIGVGWGAVMAAAAGARRTQSAYPRFLAYSHARDVIVAPDAGAVEGFNRDILKLPAVASAAQFSGLNAAVIDPKPPEQFSFGTPYMPADDRYGRSIDRPKVLRGRLPDSGSATEVLASPGFAAGLDVDVGDRVKLEVFHNDGSPTGKTITLRIVGVGVTMSEVFPITSFDRVNPLLLMTRAAFRSRSLDEHAFEGLVVRLRPGADTAAFQRRAEEIQKLHPESGTQLFFSSEAGRPGIVNRAMQPQVAALAAFAFALGITLLLVVTQTTARQIALASTEHPTLRALGTSPRHLILASLTPVAATTLVGAAIACVVAIAASPLTPIGAARIAEPHPGVAIDASVLGIGVAGLIAVLIGAAILPARHAARRSEREEIERSFARSSRLAQGATKAGLPASASTGIRMALEPGRGSSAVPVRTVVLGAVVSIIALTAAYTFGASLDHAVATPRLFGQQWDAMVDGQFSGIITSALHVGDDPSFEAVAGGSYSTIVVGGTVVAAIGIDQLRGSVFPTLLEGRAPARPDEIVLGSSTLKRIHKNVGDDVDVAGDSASRSLRIVGRSVFPAFGIGGFSPTSLGEGAALTIEGLGGSKLPPGQYSFLLVRYTDHPSSETIRRVNDACSTAVSEENLCYVLRRQPPPEISSYADVRNVPWLLTGLLAALAAATLAHGLLATVRRRRRDLAILKTLGFIRGQISATVAWQATTLALLALIGIPFGVVLGRWGWTALAGQLGIPAEPLSPLTAIVLTIPAALILANVVAALPARSAAHTRPALALRSE